MTTPAAIPPTPAPESTTRRYHLEEIVLVVLVVLSGVGVAISDSAPQTAFRYWMWMVPVFGIVSTVAAWSRATRNNAPVGRIVPTQVAHWLGAFGAAYLMYLLQTTGRMTNEAAGSATLVVLALAAFLAGVHGDWRLSVLGIVLGATAVGFALLEQFAWIVALPALALLVIGLVVYMRRGAAR
jgi:hypothetical protein